MNPNESIIIRPASVSDAEALLQIYRYYVQNTAITFEYDVPSIEEFRSRISHTLERYPYLAAVQGESILGYAYAGPFKARAAYDWSVEMRRNPASGECCIRRSRMRCGIWESGICTPASPIPKPRTNT